MFDAETSRHGMNTKMRAPKLEKPGCPQNMFHGQPISCGYPHPDRAFPALSAMGTELLTLDIHPKETQPNHLLSGPFFVSCEEHGQDHG